MAFLQSSAANTRELLTVIRDFAVNQGWTLVYDTLGTTDQIGLEKGVCCIAIGDRRSNSSGTNSYNPSQQTDVLSGGTVNDAFVCAALSTSLNPSNQRYWGHPGSIVTSYNDTDWVIFNDAWGPFPNVYLFSNAAGSYILVVMQSGPDRFTHFAFGMLDKRDLTTPDVAFALGQYHVWWPNGTNPNASGTSFNDWDSGSHDFGYAMETNSGVFQLRVPAGVLNTSYGFSGVDHVTDSNFAESLHRSNDPNAVITPNSTPFSYGAINSYPMVRNMATTGGVPLHAIPVFYRDTSLSPSLMTYLGDLPDVRFVDLSNLNVGQEIKFGSDVWQVFPCKRKDHPNLLNGQPNAALILNSGWWGLAFKKVV